jgi:hypothetical protein
MYILFFAFLHAHFLPPARAGCHASRASKKGNPIRRVASPDASRGPKIEHYTLKPRLFEAGTSGMDAVLGLVQGGIIYIFYFARQFRMVPASGARGKARTSLSSGKNDGASAAPGPGGRFWVPARPGGLVSTSPVRVENRRDGSPIAAAMYSRKGGARSRACWPQIPIFFDFLPARIGWGCHAARFPKKETRSGAREPGVPAQHENREFRAQFSSV